ncbi:MAG: type IV secretion protein IcmK [Legionellales bacterium]|nr:type IV secretion protein IcmK [Legionellales bacterium]
MQSLITKRNITPYDLQKAIDSASKTATQTQTSLQNQLPQPQRPPAANQTQAGGAQQANQAPQTAAQGAPGAAQQPPNLTAGKAVNLTASGDAGGLTDDQEALANKQAFKEVRRSAFPMSSEQIHTFRNDLDDTQRATAADPYHAPPKPTSTSMVVNLAPGSTPPAIRLAKGFVTSLLFIDSTGAPWPIVAYDVGDPQAFNIYWNKKSNTLMIQAKTPYNYGNLAVRLQNLDTPVMLTMVPGQRVVDYRIDMRVPGMGPNAKPMVSGDDLPSGTNPILLDFLDGIPPKESKRLTVSNTYAEAWLFEDKLYVRTRFNVLSPAWLATMASADGLHVYEMQKTPLVLLARHGKATQLKVEGY